MTVAQLQELWKNGDPTKPTPFNLPADKRPADMNTLAQELGYHLWEYTSFEEFIDDLLAKKLSNCGYLLQLLAQFMN